MSLLSAFGALPTIQTRKALLILDFQNDFVRSSGALHVPNTADILDNLPQLANAFRRAGDVVWVRSQYESCRSLIDSDYQERVVLGRVEDEKKKRLSQQDQYLGSEGQIGEKEPVHEEAFLTTDSPRCCRPQTPGAQFPAPVLAAIDSECDTLLDKSDYSALQSEGLILSFRTRFVTEIYLCGSLSNVSVYATALDAVRHGFSVTLIEDCLGFRDFSRHAEAMRRMADIFGACGITTEELCQELDWQETDDIAQRGGPRPVRTIVPAGLESVMDELEVKANSMAASREGDRVEERQDSRRRRIDDVLEDMSDGEDDDITKLVNMTRSRNRFAPSQTHDTQGSSGDKKVRARVRRKPGRNEQKPEQSSSSRPENRRAAKSKKLSLDICGPGDVIGEGDSRIIHDLDLPADAFEKIRNEVDWQKMYHLSGQVPRLVAVQGRSQDDGSIPIYRHPADESPPLHAFTSTVDQVRVIVERVLGHPLNHVLIQLYRDGQDRISEHSDKTLDIVRGSFICNVSLGAQRVMVLRTKTHGSDESDSRNTQRVPMPHESLFVLGEKTNMRWLHGIRPDKRAENEKSTEERAYGGERISLTFRHIGTFLNSPGDTIWGQGAISKTQDGANAVIHGDPAETERLIRAFGKENHANEFDWDATYGGGFDVVNFVTASTPQLVLSGDPVADLRARLALSENGLRYNATDSAGSKSSIARPLFIGTDDTRVAGDVQILTYLGQKNPSTTRSGIEKLPEGTQLPLIEELLLRWREYQNRGESTQPDWLDAWDKSLDGKHYLGGTAFGIDDCSLWPVLKEIVQGRGSLSSLGFPNLQQYYNRVEKRGIVKATLEEMK
ncbi:hypothetical protein ASPWEDRAFT_25917 [Aspergillus wentii DTO 134E9]|uniref:Fe2OG dioxygenase domain-containing protein n=1 Tax=Aspergillus wentii DTO 134E9 TaxID=1073089 RepID=A0A1L9RNC5_ASPWE|nr:uncharacterized protein ASPWEDRAFT_25917 [Aspergillus wentii DTO 134E9]OJJ36445.1 hypothetical protein ASPWEDRAFT_25917 [Aspergillus wentii DTO 134E9]